MIKKNWCKAVRSLLKCIWKKNGKAYSVESKKHYLLQLLNAECYILVSFIIPLSWPEWSCFVTQCKIFSKITHQTAPREVWPNPIPFSSKVGLRKYFLASELFVLRPYFTCHLTTKKPLKIFWVLLQFVFRSRWLKLQLKKEIWNYTSLFWILVKEGVGKRFSLFLAYMYV